MGVSCSFDTFYSIKRIKRNGFNSSEGIEGNSGKVVKNKMGNDAPADERKESEK